MDNPDLKELLGIFGEVCRVGTPVKFWPYTTTVLKRQAEASYDEIPGGLYRALMLALVALFKASNLAASEDNKVAFQFSARGETIFVGFYDGSISIGSAIGGDHIKS